MGQQQYYTIPAELWFSKLSIGYVNIELSSYLLKTPNDPDTTLSQNLIGCSTLGQDNCELIVWYWKRVGRQLYIIILSTTTTTSIVVDMYVAMNVRLDNVLSEPSVSEHLVLWRTGGWNSARFVTWKYLRKQSKRHQTWSHICWLS